MVIDASALLTSQDVTVKVGVSVLLHTDVVTSTAVGSTKGGQRYPLGSDVLNCRVLRKG